MVNWFKTGKIVFLNGPFTASFSLFSSFQYTVDSKKMFNINNFLPMTGFEHGPLDSEATALPTEPHNHCLTGKIVQNCFKTPKRGKLAL